jgi:hypothetical protein
MFQKASQFDSVLAVNVQVEHGAPRLSARQTVVVHIDQHTARCGYYRVDIVVAEL